jgi:acyl carrier protein
MTDEQIRSVVLRVLGEIAPEVALDRIDPTTDLREQLDIDSMDMLNWVVGIHEQLAVDIPEADYPQLATLNGCVTYLRERVKS